MAVVSSRGTTLSAAQRALLVRTETFFLGTTHPERGVDTSHRGGPAGFVRVEDGGLWWPDYPGNNMFNSFGNLAVDDTSAVLVPDFATGTSLQLSGRAAVEWVPPGSAGDDGGTGRRVRFTVQQAVSAALPVHEEPTSPRGAAAWGGRRSRRAATSSTATALPTRQTSIRRVASHEHPHIGPEPVAGLVLADRAR